MKLRYLLAVFALLPASVWAQGATQQLGPVTAGHLSMWAGNGRLMDAGGPTGTGGRITAPQNNTNPGTLPTGLGLVNSGLGYSQYSGYANGSYASLSWGFDGSGNGLIDLENTGGGSPQTLSYKINGNIYTLPGNGQGNILGPNSVTPGDAAVWLSPTSMQDLGVSPITSLPGKTLLGNTASVAGGIGIVGTTGNFGGVVLSGGQPIFTGTPQVNGTDPTFNLESSEAVSDGMNVGNLNFNQMSNTYSTIQGIAAVTTSGSQTGRLIFYNLVNNVATEALDLTGSSATFAGNITAASLSTSTGSIAGSLCRTASGVVIYKVGANCF